MTIDTSPLLEALDSVTAIPIIPFDDGQIDYAGHAKNIDYLMQNNYLDGNRKRVVAIAGTSLVHHLDRQDRDGESDGVVPHPVFGYGFKAPVKAVQQHPQPIELALNLF